MPKMDLAGPFDAQALAPGSWRLTAAGNDVCEVFLRGLEPAAAAALPGVLRVGLDWGDGGVAVTLIGKGGMRRLLAHTAVVHRSQTGVYAGLPLAGFDAAAQRFWRRIFRLLRIPGGRLLLKYLARRNGRGTAGGAGTAPG